MFGWDIEWEMDWSVSRPEVRSQSVETSDIYIPQSEVLVLSENVLIKPHREPLCGGGGMQVK